MERIAVPATVYLERESPWVEWGVVGAALDMSHPQIMTGEEEAPRDDNPHLIYISEQASFPRMSAITFIEPDELTDCDGYAPEGLVFNEDPFVAYIPSFVQESEAAHLIKASEGIFEPAHVTSGYEARQDESFRRSETALPPRDSTMRCVEERARSMQGWTPEMKLEAISTQRYHPGGFFSPHHDHFGYGLVGADRFSTFNVFLQADCEGGGTHFPQIPRPSEPGWCEYIDCESDLEGVVFKPIAGNAIYWENLRPNGTGNDRTLHQGLPVQTGVKIGMNIWTWKIPKNDGSFGVMTF